MGGFHEDSREPSAVVGITDVVARERIDDCFVVPAATPGVSILPCVLGVTIVRRHRVPYGTRDRPIFRWGSQGEPRSDAIWSRLGASARAAAVDARGSSSGGRAAALRQRRSSSRAGARRTSSHRAGCSTRSATGGGPPRLPRSSVARASPGYGGRSLATGSPPLSAGHSAY